MSPEHIGGGPAVAPTQSALRRIRLSDEIAKAETKRRRVNIGTAPVKARGSILLPTKIYLPKLIKLSRAV
jgi:hypothetical protein